MPTTFNETKLSIRRPCGAKVESNGQRVGRLSQSALHVVDVPLKLRAFLNWVTPRLKARLA